MKYLRAFFARLSGLFSKNSQDIEFNRELESHLQMHIDDNIRSGMEANEANRAARLKFGSIDSAVEAVRDRRAIPFFDGTARDLRFALRTMRKSPTFTLFAVLSLTLGIGANTTVFSIAYGALKGLPFKHADRIVYVSEVDRLKAPRDGPSMISYPDFLDLQAVRYSDCARFPACGAAFPPFLP